MNGNQKTPRVVWRDGAARIVLVIDGSGPVLVTETLSRDAMGEAPPHWHRIDGTGRAYFLNCYALELHGRPSALADVATLADVAEALEHCRAVLGMLEDGDDGQILRTVRGRFADLRAVVLAVNVRRDTGRPPAEPVVRPVAL